MWEMSVDIDIELPMKLASKHDLTLVNTAERISRTGRYKNLVLEFTA